MRCVVFDMGNVLIRFDPEHFIDRAGIADPEDRALLMEAVFRAAEWPMLDRGDLDEVDFEPIALARLPERLHAVARDFIYRWDDPLMPVPGMAALIRECKARGLSIYLLSNASRRQREYWPAIPGSECFDGCVVSAFERCVKPSPEIYRRLLHRFGLRAEDCLFVDDMPANVNAAIALGMKGFHFTGDVDALRRVLFN